MTAAAHWRNLAAQLLAAAALGACGGGSVDRPPAAATASLRAPSGAQAATLQPLLQFPPATVQFRGVSLAGAEFGANYLPGTYNRDYTYPTNSEIDYFRAKGMNLIRIPFLWERLQRQLDTSFNATELSRLQAVVDYATTAGMTVMLDPHNYARYRGNVIGSTAVPNSAFADFWSRLATEFKSNSRVVFGLMNEPHDMATEAWVSAANDAIAAIRATGAANLVAVPGNAWSGAWTWQQSWYGTPNATAMLGIVDPSNNYAYEVHQYFDSDSSGTSSVCVSDTAGADRLRDFTAWLKSHGKRAILAEFAGANNATCANAVTSALQAMRDNADVWMGWVWWAAGPWWGDYLFSLEPSGSIDKPQMSTLAPFLSGAVACESAAQDTVRIDAEQLGFPLAEQLQPDNFAPGTAWTRDYCFQGLPVARVRVYGQHWLGFMLADLAPFSRADAIVRAPDGSMQDMGSMYNYFAAPTR